MDIKRDSENPVRLIGISGDMTELAAANMSSDSSHLKSTRHWKIVASLLWLHLRYFFFHTRQLENIKKHGLQNGRIALPQLDPIEFTFANRWNLRISNLFQILRTPYARCMKRCFVIAHLMPRAKNLELIIGVLPGNINQGHAWLEMDNQVVADKFNNADEPYREVLRIPIHHH